MLELLALAPEDGWAYVHSDGRVELVQPPYMRSNCAIVDEAAVDKAIEKYGFHAVGQCFPDWADLISYLNKRVRESRRVHGQIIPEKGIGSELLRFAPAEVLRGYLDKIECELLPAGELDPAENLLHDMFKVDLVQQDHELLLRVSELLIRIQESKKMAESVKCELVEDSVDISNRFPRLVSIYGVSISEYTKYIATRKQIFPIR